MTIPGSKKAILYDKLHKYSVYSMMGIGLVTFGLVVYNCYLFKRDGVPMLLEKYRGKVEEEIEKKQREAEYLEQRKRAEKELLTDKYLK